VSKSTRPLPSAIAFGFVSIPLKALEDTFMPAPPSTYSAPKQGEWLQKKYVETFTMPGKSKIDSWCAVGPTGELVARAAGDDAGVKLADFGHKMVVQETQRILGFEVNALFRIAALHSLLTERATLPPERFWVHPVRHWGEIDCGLVDPYKAIIRSGEEDFVPRENLLGDLKITYSEVEDLAERAAKQAMALAKLSGLLGS
jgi:hypothetical protein